MSCICYKLLGLNYFLAIGCKQHVFAIQPWARASQSDATPVSTPLHGMGDQTDIKALALDQNVIRSHMVLSNYQQFTMKQPEANTLAFYWSGAIEGADWFTTTQIKVDVETKVEQAGNHSLNEHIQYYLWIFRTRMYRVGNKIWVY